ncbi:hypothetical protein VF21_07133 [Pseudogymnoascus sp. 05NY08]|nr:hypothetical protein VF21_07133 [Pseudogymnoascus sp. 05NY08]
MNIFTFFCAPPSSTFTANRCRHCKEAHGATQAQGEQQFWPNYGYVVDTETFAVPVVRGVRYVQQPLQQPVQHTQQPVQQPLHQPLHHQLPHHQLPPQPPTMPPSHTALYTLLSLPPTAPASSIKTSYHRLALLTHPDKNPDPDAAERFKALSAAYAILSDPKRRAIYDRFGEVAAGRGGVEDEGGDLMEEKEGDDDAEEEEDDDDGEKDEGEGGQSIHNTPRGPFEPRGGDGQNVHNTPRTTFVEPEPVVEQRSYEERLFEALRADHERGVEEEARRAAGRRLYERFWQGVRGRGGWGWPTRPVEPMHDTWRAMGDPMAWRRASVVGGGPMEGYRGVPMGYDNIWATGEVDEGLRERFRRSRVGGEWSPYGGWERGEGYGRFRSWSEGGGGFVRVVRGGYGGGYGRY